MYECQFFRAKLVIFYDHFSLRGNYFSLNPLYFEK
ncbi:hypothetical protein Premu_1293 [Hallella multisaccharivorax DSM 17128]|uniref:Uncharacterized protein n=1 Tax=Hallella multisaccharivorax DSM 17128 TaxID=688246 RepID=F8N9T0_9BACT|nr:hypothetical protein Premu_1293 [Hallella multisaccharivorax DSM 17128]